MVVPALNEERNLPRVLRAISRDYEVVVVDGNSSDRTCDVARAVRPDVRVLAQTGRGKGNALAEGLRAASGDIVVMLDADGSTNPAEIEFFVDALVEGADYVKGSRALRGGGSADLTHFRRLGNWMLTAMVNVLFGVRYTDLCYGYNAVWRRLVPDLRIDCDGFEVETLMGIRAAEAGLNVAEVPSFELSRIHGRSNLNAFGDGWRILRLILRERFGRARTEIDEALGESLASPRPAVQHAVAADD